jgi:hypothetical protein
LVNAVPVVSFHATGGARARVDEGRGAVGRHAVA